MAVAVSATIDTRGFAKAMKTAGPQIAKRMRKAFDQVGHKFTAAMSKRRLRGRPGLIRRTGTLARSQRHYVRGSTLSDLRMVYGIGGDQAPYARIQEFGGVVEAKNAKWLTFQIQPAGGGAANTGIWRRAKRVRIPPRLGMRALWRTERPTRVRLMRDALRQGLRDATGGPR